MISTIRFVYTWLRIYLPREEGQDLIEYALFGGLIATMIIAVATLITLGTLPNPLEGMLAGIEDCIDFDSSAASVCAPF